MASKRKYGYYIKGNKIAIIEEGTGSGICSLSGYSSQTTCEAAGGTWTENAVSTNDGEYRSPVATVSDGLEIQYAYNPSYRVNATPIINTNRFYVNGWTVVGGYLTFLKAVVGAGAVDWTASPYSAVTADTYSGSVSDYIIVRGSERWNGIHKVQTAGTKGQLVTYTKVSATLPYWEGVDVDSSTDEKIFDGSGGSWRPHLDFIVGDYVFLSGSFAATAGQGLWKVSALNASDQGGALGSTITLGTEYQTVGADAVAVSGTGEDYLLTEEYIDTSPTIADDAAGGNNAYVYKAHRDFCYIDTDVDVMDDESFDLDLSRYQANAIVYYLKAKLFEDAGDMEKREFFMREFKRQLEKSESSKKRGPYIIQGLKELR